MLSQIVIVAVFFMYTTPGLQAVDEIGKTKSGLHTISSQELHEVVQVSNRETIKARKSVQDYFARPGIKAQIQFMGLGSEKVAAQVAMLSDSEILSLHQQIMSPVTQSETAGLSKGAIWAIVLAGVATVAIISWLEIRTANNY